MPPARYDVAVDVRAMNEIVHFDPGDLTLSVDAGMRLSSLEKVLADMDQFLPIAVPVMRHRPWGSSGFPESIRPCVNNMERRAIF